MYRHALRPSSHSVWIYFIFTLGIAVLLTGCDTGALNPVPSNPQPNATQNQANIQTEAKHPSSASSSYACFTSIYDPSEPVPYQYGHLDLTFSDDIIAAAGGETLQYDYRLHDDEGQLHRLANCIIPDADAARSQVRDLLSYDPEDSNTTHTTSTPSTMDDGIEDCDMSGDEPSCEMLEVVVIADGTGGGAPVLPSPFWFIPIDGGGDPGDFGGSGGLYPCYACEPFDLDPGSCVKNDDHPLDVAILNSDNIQAEIATLWENSNPDAPNKDRLEQGAWVVETGNSQYDLVPFEEVSNNIEYTSCTIRGARTGDAPSNTVGSIHTHPATPGAPIYDLACLEAKEVPNPQDKLGAYVYRNPPTPSDPDYELTMNKPFHGYVVGPNAIWAYDGGPPDIPTPDHRLDQYERDDCGY